MNTAGMVAQYIIILIYMYNMYMMFLCAVMEVSERVNDWMSKAL